MISYGVLRGKVVRTERAENVQHLVREAGNHGYRSNHFHIVVEADGEQWRCPVNVRSQDGSEVWFKIRDAFTDHPILGDLPRLPEGLTALPHRRPGRTLDFIREPLFDRATMRHLPLQAGGANDDVQDHLELYTDQAQAQADATIYVFGSFWQSQQFPPDEVLGTSQGVHDIHMNQGNSNSFRGDDGVYQDGGVIFHLPQTNRFVGVFLAFNSQVWFTDNQSGHRLPGHPEGPLAQQGPIQPEEPVPSTARVRIIAALLNPTGEDPGKETVTLFNSGVSDIPLMGWKILDRQNKAETLDGTFLVSNQAVTIRLSGHGAQLGNRGGSIRLLDAEGQLVHAVTYTEANAVSGQIVQF
jgi:uncharacterized protein YukJ